MVLLELVSLGFTQIQNLFLNDENKISNPLDSRKTNYLLKTKTVDFSINKTYFGLSFRYAQVNSFLLIPFFEEKFSYISSNDCLSRPVS